jgi:hypothetical protein
MINEFEYYHGAALRAICEGSESPVTVEVLDKHYDNSAYAINDSVALYIKHSKKRLTPWKFSFYKQHQDFISELKNIFDDIVILLVCGYDGVVGLSFDELKLILDSNHEDIEWVKVERRKREQYKVSGTDGELSFKITHDEFISKALNKL